MGDQSAGLTLKAFIYRDVQVTRNRLLAILLGLLGFTLALVVLFGSSGFTLRHVVRMYFAATSGMKSEDMKKWCCRKVG